MTNDTWLPSTRWAQATPATTVLPFGCSAIASGACCTHSSVGSMNWLGPSPESPSAPVEVNRWPNQSSGSTRRLGWDDGGLLADRSAREDPAVRLQFVTRLVAERIGFESGRRGSDPVMAPCLVERAVFLVRDDRSSDGHEVAAAGHHQRVGALRQRR